MVEAKKQEKKSKNADDFQLMVINGFNNIN